MFIFNRIFNSQSKTITFAAALLGFSALVSRILGLVRDRLLAGRFGTGAELDAYFAAFQIPDLIYGILILGGIGAVFLPVFSEYFERNKEEGWVLTNQVLNFFLVLLVIICGVLIIFTPWLIKLIVPGFSEAQRSLTTALTRIMFLSPILFGISSVFSGVLHYFNRFLIYSLAPILYNLGIIFGILVLVPIFGIFGLAYGVIFGALLHWLIQIFPAKSSGFSWKPLFDFRHPGLKRIFKLMIPRTIARASFHVNLIVITAIASTLTVGSITIFNFAHNLYYLPIGVIGMSFAMASFPSLSRAWNRNNKEEFLEKFSSTFRQILFLIVPISLLSFLLREQIVRIILGSGRFELLDIKLTAASLGLFSLGIFAVSLSLFLARTFFSLQDTKTPALVGISSMVLNVILSFTFVWLFTFSNVFQEAFINFLQIEKLQGVEIIGLPLAHSISMIFQFFLLFILLYKKMEDIRFGEILNSFKVIIFASFLMALIVYFILQITVGFVNIETFLGSLFQILLAGLIGILVYFGITFILNSPEIKIIWHSILRQFRS